MAWTAILLAVQIVAPSETLTVQVDSARHEIVLTAGPFDAPAMEPMPGMDMMMDHSMAQDSPLLRFTWPVTGWVRGFRLSLTDGEGRPVPRRVLHHLIVVNFGRRQLLYPAYERLFGAGAETEDVVLPRTVGVPMDKGMPLGLYAGWHNETGSDLPAVYLRVVLLWSPANLTPAPVSALPWYADVNLDIGGSNTFDVPPGISRRSFEFTMPLSGRLLGLGGHLHDFGREVRLEDAGSGRVVTALRARRDSAGTVSGLERRLFGVRGDGLRLRRDRGYRVVGVYDNPTGETRIKGAMAHLVGLFVPDHLSEWPRLEGDAESLRRDLAGLQIDRPTGDSVTEDAHARHH